MRVTKRIKYFVRERKPYLETIKWDPDKPFGVIVIYEGRGKGVTVIGSFQPGQDPGDCFPQVKQRFLDAIKEWLNKGWIDKNDVRNLIP